MLSEDVISGLPYKIISVTKFGWKAFISKNYKNAVSWTKEGSELGFSLASYNLGLFYYAGLAGQTQDIIKAKNYWILSAEQWKFRSRQATAENFLKEINQYSKDQTKKMIELRDAYLEFVEDPSPFYLEKFRFFHFEKK